MTRQNPCPSTWALERSLLAQAPADVQTHIDGCEPVESQGHGRQQRSTRRVRRGRGAEQAEIERRIVSRAGGARDDPREAALPVLVEPKRYVAVAARFMDC